MDTNTHPTELLLTENVSRNILYIIKYLLSLTVNSSRKENRKKISLYLQILKVALKEHGELIFRHFLQYEACTAFELYEVYGINYTTAGRILNLMQETDIIKQTTRVGGRGGGGDGRRSKIYAFIDADPKRSLEAQSRYWEIMLSKNGGNLRQAKLEEAFNIIKLYMDERNIRRVPDTILIRSILDEKEIRGVNYNSLITILVNEGYKA